MNATAQRLYQAVHEYHAATKSVYSASHEHGRYRQTVTQAAITILVQVRRHMAMQRHFMTTHKFT
jgi:hypothetical protein